MSQLGVTLEGAFLSERIQQLYSELEARQLCFRPHMWVCNEWFTPDGVPGIAVPFYLAPPRPARLALEPMLGVGGGPRAGCMRIWGHGAGPGGHAGGDRSAVRAEEDAARAVCAQAPPLWDGPPVLVRSGPQAPVFRRAGPCGAPERRHLLEPLSQRGAPQSRRLDRRISIYDRSDAGGHD